MTSKEELKKLRQSLLELRARETLYRHVSDREPEKYDNVNKQLKVVKRRMTFLKSKQYAKKRR